MARALINESSKSTPRAQTAATTKRPKKSSSKGASNTTLQTIRSLQTQGKEDHGKAAATSKKYNEYTQRGRIWLKDHSRSVPLAEEDSEEESIYDDPEFRNAFNDKPNKYSDKALALYISFKIFHENLGQGTCDGIYSAFKLLWRNACVLMGIILAADQINLCRDGDTYRGKWAYNDARQQWEGNPAESAEVQDVREAVKHKCGAEGGDRKHSLAMSKDYMERLFAWSEKICPQESYQTEAKTLEEQALRTKHLQFRAFSSTAWTIWSR